MILDGLTSRSLAQHKSIDSDPVLASVEFSAQNLDTVRGERAGQIGKQAVTILHGNGEFGRSVTVSRPAAGKALSLDRFNHLDMHGHRPGRGYAQIPIRQ